MIEPGRSSGYSLVEVLVALVVAGVFLAGLASLLDAFSSGAREVIRRTDQAQAVRAIWVVLDEETSAGRWGEDWTMDGGHALTLRAFRGLGVVTGPSGQPDRWEVEWVGHRTPDPDRDSLLVLTADGRWSVAELEWAGGASGSEPAVRALPGSVPGLWGWRPTGDVEPVLVRLFESGRYSLEDGAFRYRRGDGGRQPLTPEILGPGSRFALEEEGVRVKVEFREGDRVDWLIPFRP